MKNIIDRLLGRSNQSEESIEESTEPKKEKERVTMRVKDLIPVSRARLEYSNGEVWYAYIDVPFEELRTFSPDKLWEEIIALMPMNIFGLGRYYLRKRQ